MYANIEIGGGAVRKFYRLSERILPKLMNGHKNTRKTNSWYFTELENLAKRVPVWHGIFYKKGTIGYLSFKVAGTRGSRPDTRLKKNSRQPSWNTGHSTTGAKCLVPCNDNNPNDFFSSQRTTIRQPVEFCSIGCNLKLNFVSLSYLQLTYFLIFKDFRPKR